MGQDRASRRPTMADVARRAGVSVATVSYVVNGMREGGAPTRIRPETAERVHGAMEEVGYSINLSARSLRRRRTDRILFLAQRFTSPYSQAMARALEETLGAEGHHLSVQIGSDVDHIHRAISTLDQNIVDGLIVETGDTWVPELRKAAEAGHAIVAVGPTSPDPVLDTVVYQERDAIRDAMAYLHERQPDRYLLFSTSGNEDLDQRASAAFEALIWLGVPETSIIVRFVPHDREEAFQAALSMLPDMPHPIAIYASSDVSAIGVLWACLRLSLRVPQEVAVLGHGNIGEAKISFPPLTTLGPIAGDPSAAAGLMLSRLKDRSHPGRNVVLPWQLVKRQSA